MSAPVSGAPPAALSSHFTSALMQPVEAPPAATSPSATAATSYSGLPVSHLPVDAATSAPVATPVPHAAPVVSTAAPVAPVAPVAQAPVGPLPGYGTDLRPAAAPAVVATPAVPATAPAAPATAPASSAASALNQPALVRQSAAVAAQPAAAAFAQQAVVATAAGAIVGSAAQTASARGRLQRLLDFVARQQPRLRWAIADRADGTTALATDLASGWIPPDIDIPMGVQMLEPARRRGDLTAILGETEQALVHTPGQFIGDPDELDRVSVSYRARQAPAVEDLNWGLSQATMWRDGLPRLAHTLAKAAASGTGILDSEVEMLAAHISRVKDDVLRDYPASDNQTVANYMLLAAIAAIVADNRTVANYHFAWYQAVTAPALAG